MKSAALLAILLWQTAPEPPVAQPSAMRYERAISLASGSGQACAVLDAQVFPHAAPSLADLRIFPANAAAGAAHEIPFAITISDAATQETQAAQILNLGTSGGRIVFDLEMPARPYTDVTLNLDPSLHDFLATASVSASDTLGGRDARSVSMGPFTLFDLTSQHLSRDTTLPLEESTFHYLHVELSVAPAPGALQGSASRLVPAMVQGAQVPPSREAQILYTTVAESAAMVTSGRESHVTFQLPRRVPVERVSFQLPPGYKGNFSRDVRITALAQPDPAATNDARPALPETVSGTILRVHTTQGGREIRTEQLGVPAILGANLQTGAKVEVDIENGDDQPLPIASVRLEMRQREICFDMPATGGLALFYGDSKLQAPLYDYAQLFQASQKALAAELGPEAVNAGFREPADSRTFVELHPEVLWIVLLAVICMLGAIAIRSARNVGHPR